MSQTNVLIALVVGFAVVVGGYFVFTSSEVDTSGAPTKTADTVAPEDPTPQTGKKMAFSQLMKQGGSYKCTVHQYVGDTDTEGTTYLHDGMMRGEFSTVVQGMSIDTTLVTRDGYSHTWTSMTPSMGFKSKIVETTSSDSSTPPSGSYSFNAEQIGDYDCQSWTADVSKFSLPSGTIFTEVK